MSFSLSLIPLTVLPFVLVVGAARLLRLRSLRRAFSEPLPGAWPYYARHALLTNAELSFYNQLRKAVGNRYTVAPKVRLADVIHCPDGVWVMGYGRLIAQKHIDFILCDPATTRIVLAIELDDRSHAHPKRKARDLFVDRALAAAGVPLLRVPAAAIYDPGPLRQAVVNGVTSVA
jgi:hypothetical protein